LEEGDRLRIAAVLAADAHNDLRPRLPPVLHGHPHELPHPVHIDDCEGVLGQDLLVQVELEELGFRIVP
jgi:hypothetical protein